MGRPEDTEFGRCQATAKSTGEQCGRAAIGAHGKCDIHGGKSTGGAGDGAPEDNTRAVTHGLYAETNRFYQDVLDDATRQLVDDIFADYLEEYEARHGEPATGTEAELFRIAVSYGKHVHADNWAIEKPDSLESGNATVDQETHYTDGGQQYYRYKETVVAKGQARLSRDRRSWLKDLGLLDDPESQKADALGDLSGGAHISFGDD